MALLKAEAEKLSQNDMLRGVIEEFYTTDQMFGMLDFQPIDGKAYVYNREKTLAKGAWLDPNEIVPESTSDFEQITTTLKINAGDVDVDKFLDGTMSNINSQKSIQIASKVKGMSRDFRDLLINGDEATNSKHFNGLDKLVALDRVIGGASANALTLSQIDELLDAVDTGTDAIIMRKGTYRAYKTLLRQAGGITPDQIMIKDFGYVPAHDGTPILVNDYIAGNVDLAGTDTCSIYAVNFDPAVGFHMIFGGGPAGFRMEDLGTVQNKDATRTRIKQYVGSCLKSTASVAKLAGISNV